MKYIAVIFLFCIVFASCNEEYPEPYKGAPLIRFSSDENVVVDVYVQHPHVNFLYADDPSIEREIVRIPLEIIGSVPEQDLHLSMEIFNADTMSYPERIDENTLNAEAGIHYIPFNDEEMDNMMTFHAGRMQDTISIIVLRDQSMKDDTYRLSFRLAQGENYIVADSEENRAVVYMADKLSQPQSWSYWNFVTYFGTYGEQKHAFMIRHSNLLWSDEDIDAIKDDNNVLSYYRQVFRAALVKENAELGENGPLREADDTPVQF